MSTTRSARGAARTGLALALVTGAALALAGCSADSAAEPTESGVDTPLEPDGDITWLTWEGYVDPDVVSEFEEEYGVTVNFEYFDSDEQALQKLSTGQPYDLFTGNSGYMERTMAANLLQPVNWDAIDTSDLLPYFQDPWYDDGEERYTVPNGYGPTGFLYNTQVVTNDTDSWEAFWTNPDARISVLPMPEETIGMSLLNLGYEVTSDDPDEIAEATDALLEFKDQVVEYAFAQDVVLNGQVDLAHTFTGEAFTILQELDNPEDWAFTLVDGQTPIGGNFIGLGAQAEHPGTAMLFMDWMMKPENSARNTVYTGYYFGTNSSSEAMNELLTDYPFLRVEDDSLETAAWKNSATGERLEIMTEEWNRYKAS